MDDAVQPRRSPSEEQVEAILDLDRRILEAYVLRRDPSLLRKHAPDDYFVMSPGGVEPLQHVVATVGNLDVDDLAIHVAEVRDRGSQIVIAGFMEGRGLLQGRPLPRLGFLSVWSHEDGTWRLTARSLVPQAPRPSSG